MSTVAKVRFADYPAGVAAALDAIGAADRLPRRGLVIVKPNLTNADAPPVTTPPAAAEAVWRYCRDRCGAEVVIGEGCGSGTTEEVFAATGYAKLARREGIRLIDFNAAPAAAVSRPDALQLETFHLPEVAREALSSRCRC